MPNCVIGYGPPQRSNQRSPLSHDAIDLLKDEQIRRALREFEKAGDAAYAAKGRAVDRIIELLTIHTYMENEVMYQRVRALLP